MRTNSTTYNPITRSRVPSIREKTWALKIQILIVAIFNPKQQNKRATTGM